MPLKTSSIAPLVLAAILACGSTAAEARRKVQEGSPTVDAVVKCRTIADSAQRLACYDSSVAPLETAMTKKEIIIVDRTRAEEANRSLFGFSAPAISQLFGLKDVEKLESTVAGTGYNGNGGVTVTLADDSRWSQQDDKQMWGDIKNGTPVTVVRGTLGSYIVKIKGQNGFKAIRIR